ncbi:putative Pyridine nucleotide disulfide oxidoreductase Lycopene cyclase protein [Trypanosoma vivax]|nr:putative Pyridine nucleotide disulfide oxidoreductase Lycopene cyclase protein [Trypanosoma vivax]
MYLPKHSHKPKENPFAVQKSRRFIAASGAIAFFTVVMSSYFALEKVRERRRRPDGVLGHHRRGKRVVIIGAGTAGCALASSLTTASPDLHVTVIERNPKHVFHAAVPLAHVGHRSYDLNTTGGVDFLRSPATWNVTREAVLVLGEVVRVDTAQNEVVVREEPQPHTTASSPTQESSPRSLWAATAQFFSKPRTAECERRYPYDALVLACGAERVLGPLERFITTAQVDRHRIAVNPGITRDCLVHTYKGTILHVKVPPTSFVCDKSSTPQAVRYAARQHDGTFIGTVNTIWRYLYYFNKHKFCQYLVVSADRQPSDAFPATLNERILSFWHSRGVNFTPCTYITHIDPYRSVATLYNYSTKEKQVVPYQLLLLDLPLAAPSFIRESGLSGSVNVTEGFVDVEPHTLQHRKYKNIFAIGDCAGLPTVKSYGAALAQVPVVSHNVRVHLTRDVNEATDSEAPPCRFARYDGYSSFHIVMTTWRAMWPEMTYGAASANEGAALVMTNNHIWDNLAWTDIRGFLNAAYYQLFLYEIMFYFFFTRAAWYPPRWFSIPSFNAEGNIV